MTRALIVAALVAAATTAHADDRRRIIGILDVRAAGLPADIAQQFEGTLESQLDSKRYWLVPRAKVRERMTASTRWADGCYVGKCLVDVKTQTGADLVLLVSLSGSGTSYGYVVTLVRTDLGEAVAQQSDRCDVCTLNEVMTNATLATIQLINQVPDALPDREADRRTQLALATDPLRREAKAARAHPRHLAVGLAVVGLVVAGAGAGLYAATSKAPFIGVAGAGAGALVGGITLLAF